MKTFLPLLCVALLVLPAGTRAAELGLNARIGVDAGLVLALAGGPDRHRRQNDDDQNNGSQNNGGDRGENRRDNRINVAISIAQSYGRVLDAGQESGAIFWVRVATDHGRVDLLIDTDSGRVIGRR